MELIPTRRRPFYLNIVIPVAVDGVIVPVTVKLLRVPSGFLTSLKRLGVRLVVKGIRKHRDHKQVDDEADGERKRFSFDILSSIECAELAPDCDGEERLKGGVEVRLSHLRR